jgi:hypothetical protein
MHEAWTSCVAMDLQTDLDSPLHVRLVCNRLGLADLQLLEDGRPHCSIVWMSARINIIIFNPFLSISIKMCIYQTNPPQACPARRTK